MSKRLKDVKSYTPQELYKTLRNTLHVYDISSMYIIGEDSKAQDAVMDFLVRCQQRGMNDAMIYVDDKLTAGTKITATHNSGVVCELVLISDNNGGFLLYQPENAKLWNSNTYNNTIESLTARTGSGWQFTVSSK